MVDALMGGQPLSATDLALEGEVTAQTASSHLSQLVSAGLLHRRRQGRHRFYELASAEVADALESLVELGRSKGHPMNEERAAFRAARTCYDHLAGTLGVLIVRSLRTSRCLRARGASFQVTHKGHAFFERLGIDVESSQNERRVFARRCLDRTERVPHLGGALGAAFAEHCFQQGWVVRNPGNRTLSVTAVGRRAFERHLGVEWAGRTARS